ncbi:MAG: Asp-tRNA(Asn)/Glu-tRNA(Gln) amidotransferase subunit GatC [Tepidisphaera sp.]|nr:Asp-tRNA(Asn)/Glu-tRNA(Gln) amidotransferase subunit GatC [Tepidisphaera sp.]
MSDVPHGLTKDQTRKIARLARLALSDAELDKARLELSAVIGYVERLRGLDLEGVEPLAGVTGAMRRGEGDGSDEPGRMLPVEAMEKMAPAMRDRFLAIPKVLDDGGSA